MAFVDKISKSHKMKLGLTAAIISILGLTMFAAATSEQPIGEKHKAVYDYGGDFVLKNHTGNIALKDFRGKVVVAYFGFLNCTEACPLSMATIVKAVDKLTPEEREKLQVFFISVDPKRDDIESLKEFADHYAKRFKNDSNPNLIQAITGTQEEIDAVSKQYGVFFDLIDMEGSGLQYTIDHSSRFYMIGGDGDLVTAMNHSTTPTELAAKIKELQNETLN